LIVAVRRYRNTDPVALYSLDHGWRLVVATGEPATYLRGLGADPVDSAPVARGTIEGFAASQGVLADLFQKPEAA
jgi:hypothetical protein